MRENRKAIGTRNRARCSTYGTNSEARMQRTLHYLNTNPASSVLLIDVEPPMVSIFIRWQTHFTWPITLTAFHWCVKDGRKERKKRTQLLKKQQQLNTISSEQIL